MAEILRIALVMELISSVDRDILKGIYRHILRGKRWAVRRFAPYARSASALKHWSPDGIIATLRTDPTAAAMYALGKPIVNVSGALHCPGTGQVHTDEEAAGRLAAQHLYDKGLRNMAYISALRTDFSISRRAGFSRWLRRHGIEPAILDRTCPTFRSNASLEGPEYEERLRQWLLSLPKPVGIFACNDYMSLELAEICRLAELHLPDNVSLIGTDNDELLCSLASPPLSSVQLPTVRIGYEAARLLDAMIRGAKPRRMLLKPLGVVGRQSTDVVAVEDVMIARAIRFIRQNAHEPIGVEDILREVPISRRSLEQRFGKLLGRSPLDEILRTRIERAQHLLVETDMKLREIAAASGFRNASRLCHVFRKCAGMNPTDFRRQQHAS